MRNNVPDAMFVTLLMPLASAIAATEGQTTHYLPGLAQYARNAWTYSLPDPLGSVRQLIDAPGQVVLAQSYAPFGGIREQAGAGPSGFGYAGEQQDALSQLIYLRARYYDPTTGRFLSKDPFPGLASLPQTQQPYVYAGNNPVNLTDPTGEIAPIIVAAGLGGAIGAVGGGVGYVLAHPGGRPENYLRSGGFWQSVGTGAASGAVAGAVGWWMPTLLPASGFWGSVGAGALSGALSSGAGQVTTNLLNPCVDWYHDLGWAMATGGVFGGVAGGVGYGISRIFGNKNVNVWAKGSRDWSLYSKEGRIEYGVLSRNYRHIHRIPAWLRGKRVLHYHRRGFGGLGRHRPWEISPSDTSFWSRF